MTTDTVPQTVLFPDLFDKPLVAKFNQEQASSDGGALLLKGAERVYGFGQGVRPVPERQARAGEDSANARGPDRPAHLRHRLRPSRLQRCRAPRRRPHPQAAARPRAGGGRVTRLAADALAVRERGWPQRALRHRVRFGGACCRAAPPPAGWAGAAHHDRSGPDRAPNAHRPAVQPADCICQFCGHRPAAVATIGRRLGRVADPRAVDPPSARPPRPHRQEPTPSTTVTQTSGWPSPRCSSSQPPTGSRPPRRGCATEWK